MRVLEKRTYVGPNLYANFQVIRMTLDLGPLEFAPSAEIPGFVERLVATIPTLAEHGCSYGEHGGFLRRLSDDGGTWMGHVHGARRDRDPEPRGLARHVRKDAWERRRRPVPRRSTSTSPPGSARQAGELALRLLHHLVPGRAAPGRGRRGRCSTSSSELQDLIRGAQRRALGPSTMPAWCAPPRLATSPGSGSTSTASSSSATASTRSASRPRSPARRATSRSRSPRQGADQPDPGRHRACPCRADQTTGRPKRPGGAHSHRLPGRGQAARRQPRPRRERSASRPTRQVAVAFAKAREHSAHRAGRELHPGLRPPHARGQRRAGRGRQAGARPRGRRRRAHHRAARRDREPATRAAASATRRCSPGSSSTTRRSACWRSGRPHRRHRAARRRGVLLAQHRQPVHRRHGDRPDRRVPPRQRVRWRSCGQAVRPRRVRRRLPHARHHPHPTTRSAAASAR
jgi:hypothetical protein